VIRYTFTIILLLLIANIAQQFIPILTELYNARVLLIPLVFLCAAVTVNYASMLLLAFLCGFLWDAQNSLGAHGGDPSVYEHPVASLVFGYSIILYALMGFLMQGIQPLFRQGKWHFSALLSGVAVFLYLLAEFLLINFVRGDFAFPAATRFQILYSSLLTMIFSPLVFAILFKLAKLTGFTIRYDGLKESRTRRFVLHS
jgi:hypothetical protein